MPIIRTVNMDGVSGIDVANGTIPRELCLANLHSQWRNQIRPAGTSRKLSLQTFLSPSVPVRFAHLHCGGQKDLIQVEETKEVRGTRTKAHERIRK